MVFGRKKPNTGRKIRLCLAEIAALIVIAAVAFADEPKRTLIYNMTEAYHVLPESADSLSEIFTKGMAYGRLRLNYFYWELRFHLDRVFYFAGQ